MPIPHSDAGNSELLGAAAFLKIERAGGGSGYAGALFLVNSRGEPLEFSYNKIETPHSFLWRGSDIERYVARSLSTSLFAVCSKTPRVIVCLANEIPADLFVSVVSVSIPVCRVAPAMEAVPFSGSEVAENIEASAAQLFWFPGPPPEDSDERKLVDCLIREGLLFEPFDRAHIGLKEVFGSVQEKSG